MSGLASVLLFWAIDLTINTMRQGKGHGGRIASDLVVMFCEAVTAAFIVSLVGYIAGGGH